MARLFLTGAENGSLDVWDNWSVTPDQAFANPDVDGMQGSYCIDISAQSAYVAKTISPSKSEIYCSFLVRTLHWSNCLVSFWDGSTLLGELNTDSSTGNLKAYKGCHVGGTLLGTGAIMSYLAWNLIEVRFKPHGSTGVFQVKLNGILTIDVTGADTTAGSVSAVRHGYHNVSIENPGFAWIDNVVYDDASWIGSPAIAAIRPNGDGGTHQWTPSTGENWECVNEVPPNDTDFVHTNTVGNYDMHAASGLTLPVSSIQAVQVSARCVKVGSPTPLNLKLMVNTHSTEYESASKAIPEYVRKSLSNVWELNPFTSAAWTTQEITDLLIGYKAAT